MNKIRRIIEKAMLWMLRALRTIFVIVLDILLAIAIIVLCIVAILTTAAEKFFALLASFTASLLGKMGRHLLKIKE